MTRRPVLALLAVACLGLSIWAAQAGAAKNLPNLKTTEISNPPATAHAGDQIQISNKVKNAGKKTAAASVERFYLTASGKRANPLRLIGDESIGKLKPGVTANASGSFAISHDTPDGTYSVVGCADDKHAVHESSETDNCRESKTTMVVQGF